MSGPRRRPRELRKSSVIRGDFDRTTHIIRPLRFPVRFTIGTAIVGGCSLRFNHRALLAKYVPITIQLNDSSLKGLSVFRVYAAGDDASSTEPKGRTLLCVISACITGR
jgi:hypothetical protein